MKLKIVLSFILCLVVGVLIGKYILGKYQNPQTLIPVFEQGEKVYFFQYGVYSTLESMQEQTKGLLGFVYSKENEKYHVYLGMTKESANVEKLKGYFKNLKYDIYVKEVSIKNKPILEMIGNYDMVMLQTDQADVIKASLQGQMDKYKELMSQS